MIEPREVVTRVYRAGIAAADPARATRQAVDGLRDLVPRVLLLSVGKAANGMASGAVEALGRMRVTIAGGLVVANETDPSATHGLEVVQGDHPTPGARSLAAAQRLVAVAARSRADEDAIVLVSGGATSLIAAPVAPITGQELRDTFDVLLASGADIATMNAIRKRILRFGAGRLAVALASRTVRCLVSSDVIGNDVAAIASGPCVPDTMRSREVRDRAIAAGYWNAMPGHVRDVLDALAERRAPDVPPPDHPRFATTAVKVILDRGDAERGAADAALELGAAVTVVADPLSGEAATAGRRFADLLLNRERSRPEVVIWSGEPTVTLGARSGKGGRCLEFALACAAALETAGPPASGITVLAAGSDGRDGPTDAAGAIVDSTTCGEIRARGLNPDQALQEHDSYNTLDSIGALLRTGATGTNVNDLVVGLIAARK